ncbi:MAG: hypothetical protein R6U91_01310 [Bacillota bacterium]
MRKILITVSLVVILMVAVSGVVFATGGYGSGCDNCPKAELTEEELARFEGVIEEYREAMEEFRGDPEAQDERMELREEKRESLFDIAPDRFADCFGHFGEKGKGNRNYGAKKASSNGAQRGAGR